MLLSKQRILTTNRRIWYDEYYIFSSTIPLDIQDPPRGLAFIWLTEWDLLYFLLAHRWFLRWILSFRPARIPDGLLKLIILILARTKYIIKCYPFPILKYDYSGLNEEKNESKEKMSSYYICYINFSFKKNSCMTYLSIRNHLN